MPAPTPEQKAKERALLYTNAADLTIVLLVLTFAIVTSSLTLISEVPRMALMLSVELYSIYILCALHRDRLRQFRFGIGKVEQIFNLAIGAALVVSGLWVAERIVATLFFGAAAATPLGLAAAALVNAVNTLINALGYLAMRYASRSDDSTIYRAQLRSRKVGLVTSLLLQVTLTVAVLAKDPVISLSLDALGAIFVVGIMLWVGARMVDEALPHLLDHAVPSGVRKRIEQALARAGVTLDELVRLRTRHNGGMAQVELTMALAPHASLADFKARALSLERMFRNDVPDAEVSIVVDASGPP